MRANLEPIPVSAETVSGDRISLNSAELHHFGCRYQETRLHRNVVGGPSRNRTGVHGFAIRCVTTPPRGLWPSFQAVILECQAVYVKLPACVCKTTSPDDSAYRVDSNVWWTGNRSIVDRSSMLAVPRPASFTSAVWNEFSVLLGVRERETLVSGRSHRYGTSSCRHATGRGT